MLNEGASLFRSSMSCVCRPGRLIDNGWAARLDRVGLGLSTALACNQGHTHTIKPTFTHCPMTHFLSYMRGTQLMIGLKCVFEQRLNFFSFLSIHLKVIIAQVITTWLRDGPGEGWLMS